MRSGVSAWLSLFLCGLAGFSHPASALLVAGSGTLNLAPAFRVGSGSYAGLLVRADGSQAGYLQVLVRESRATGSLRLAGQRPVPLRLVWNGGDLEPASNLPGALALRLSSTLSPGGESLRGTVTAGGTTFSVSLPRLLSTPGAPARFSLILNQVAASTLSPLPLAGVGVGRLGARGQVRVAGLLADGSVFSAGGQVDYTGHWNWLAQTTGRGGTVVGSVAFPSEAPPQGTATWARREAASALLVSASRLDPARAPAGLYRFDALGASEQETSGSFYGEAAGLRALRDPGFLLLPGASGLVVGAFRAYEGTYFSRRFAGVYLADSRIMAGFIFRGRRVVGLFQATPAEYPQSYGKQLNQALRFNGRPEDGKNTGGTWTLGGGTFETIDRVGWYTGGVSQTEFGVYLPLPAAPAATSGTGSAPTGAVSEGSEDPPASPATPAEESLSSE